MNLHFERDALKEAVCNSRALFHGWALAYRIARPSKGSEAASNHGRQTCTAAGLSSLPYAVQQRCQALLQPFTNPCPSDVEDNAGRPLIFLRSNPASDIVFLLHPTAARYSKLLLDLVEMIEEMGEDCDEEDLFDATEDCASYDTSRVSLADLMPFDISSIREACRSREEEETRRSEQQQHQASSDGSDGLTCNTQERKEECRREAPYRQFPAADVCRSSTVLPDASDFADDWRNFYTEHSIDAALHTFGPQLLTSNSAEVQTNSSSVAGGGNGAPTDGHDVAALFQSQLLSFLKTEKELSKLQSGASSTTTTRRRPRPIVVDVLGYDNAVLAVIAAFAHSLVISHHDLATRGNLRNPAPTLGWGKGNMDEFEQEEGGANENVKREPETTTGNSEGATSAQSGTPASPSSLIAQKLAFTKPQKPAKSLLITSLYGNSLGPKVSPEVAAKNAELRESLIAAMESSGRQFGLGGLTSSNPEQRRQNAEIAALTAAMRPSLPYLPYEAVTARHNLLPFVGNYRRPFNFEIGGEKAILKMLLEKVSSGGGSALPRLPVPSEFRTVAFMILLSEKKANLAAERAAVANKSAASSKLIPSNSTAFVLVPPPPPPPKPQTESEPTPPPQQPFIPGRNTFETAHALSLWEENSGRETEAALLSPSEKVSSPSSSPTLPAAEESRAGNDQGCRKKEQVSAAPPLPLAVNFNRPRPEGYVTLDTLKDPTAARRVLKKLYETETNALVDAISRTSSVMNAANFLQMTPLIELCGLSLAMIMRGRSLEESRELFSAAVNYTCLDEE